jgi:membrane-associated phospholipid phosphatase
MKERQLIKAAHILGLIFTPLYLPITGFLALFIFSYLSLLPWSLKLYVLVVVYLFTILIPMTAIRIYRKLMGWKRHELGHREKRMIPYILSITSYCCCYYLMNSMHWPRFMGGIVIAALVIQIACAIINVWWKISAHTAAVGGVTGALIAFSLLFLFNPVWWLCLVIILSGLLCTSRIILYQHSLSQVLVGYVIGMIGAFFSILFI